MPTDRRSIGSQGLEQGGPDLGNDYSVPPRTTGSGNNIPVMNDLDRDSASRPDEEETPVLENEDQFEEETLVVEDDEPFEEEEEPDYEEEEEEDI